MTTICILFVGSLLTLQISAWEALPNIPTGRRSQFLVLHENGAYKYGYDTGVDHAAKQEADPSNQVLGHYFYKNAAGQDFDLKYSSGVQGFQPEGLAKLEEFIHGSSRQAHSLPQGDDDNSGQYKPDNSGDYHPESPENSGVSQPDTPDDSGAYKPEQPGAYEPENSGGGAYVHDNSGDYKGEQEPSGDASYMFNVDTASYKRVESSDANGNIHGSYSYHNKDGNHELQYEAGAGKGFIARSGVLSVPTSYHLPASGPVPIMASSPLNPDGSYVFKIAGVDHSRDESADANGNVHGRFSYTNAAGQHDLSYKAGAETGFVPTGGSLAIPNGLGGYVVEPSPVRTADNPDGSYSFEFALNDQARQEHSDAGGNVQGRYSYKNTAGNHDLSYIAGSGTGFLPTGGSLSQPNGLGGVVVPGMPNFRVSEGSAIAEDALANTGDASYQFSFDTPEYQREESSDPQGNVKGSFFYKSAKGSGDLNFVAGTATGFQPTGGSLATPNGLHGQIAQFDSPDKSGIPMSDNSDSVEISAAAKSADGGDSSSGDASYNFSFDTDEYKRHESSDANGNVKGSFSYTNNVGNHDLNFVSGRGIGFQPIGGNLIPAPGLNQAQLRAGLIIPARTFVHGVVLPETKNAYRLGRVKVHTYLPPSNEKMKFGYIFDTQ